MKSLIMSNNFFIISFFPVFTFIVLLLYVTLWQYRESSSKPTLKFRRYFRRILGFFTTPYFIFFSFTCTLLRSFASDQSAVSPKNEGAAPNFNNFDFNIFIFEPNRDFAVYFGKDKFVCGSNELFLSHLLIVVLGIPFLSLVFQEYFVQSAFANPKKRLVVLQKT